MEGHEITRLLDRRRCGQRKALDELVPLVYAEQSKSRLPA
jgi:hypothetical protein